MEISGDVTDAGRTDGQTREDSATQPLVDGRLSFAIRNKERVLCLKILFPACIIVHSGGFVLYI